MKQLWFTTTTFAPHSGEEGTTNPERFGEAVAIWLKTQLASAGYAITGDPIPEDWGWVVMVQREPFSLWIGCGNEEGNPSRWGLFVEAELGVLQKLFKRIAPSTSVNALEQDIERFVREAGFEDIEWEQM